MCASVDRPVATNNTGELASGSPPLDDGTMAQMQPIVKKPTTVQARVKRSWVVDGVALLLMGAFALWLETVLQDWLFSRLTPYPYAASSATSLGVLTGFVALWRVRDVARWRTAMLFAGTVLVVATLLHRAIDLDLGLGSAVSPSAWLGAMCGAALVDVKSASHQKRLGLSAALLLAAADIAWNAWNLGFWAANAAIFAAACGGGALAMWIGSSSSAKRGILRFRSVGLLVLLGGIGLLLAQLIVPMLASEAPEFGWMGIGLGHRTFPIFWPGVGQWAPIVAEEQGAIAVWSVAFAMTAALAACGLAWSGVWQNGHEQNATNATRDAATDTCARLELCAGSIGGFYGMLLGAQSGPPFLTVDSAGGTWALSLAIAAVGIGAFARAPRPALAQPVERATQTFRRRRSVVLALWAGTVLMGLGVVYQSTLGRTIAPFRGSGAPPGFVSFTPLPAISVSLQDATIAMEDRNFYRHRGFDWTALHYALRANLREGKVLLGGSTISQQLAKNLFLSHDRTLSRKFQEAALTFEMERTMSKARILELYLNAIDYGMKQRGIMAATQYYFHKTPARLSLSESVILVGIVPDPPQKSVSMARLWRARETPLQRLQNFSGRYSPEALESLGEIPIERLVYPWKTAWDRGATAQISDVWHGVSFFYVPSSESAARPIFHVSPALKPPLAAFLRDARTRFGLIGIGHLGVYADRLQRDSDSVLSSHAFGQAIDLSIFYFSDGSRVRVQDHADPRVAARLQSLRVLLSKYFDRVIDWRDDPKRHHNHFHAEVQGQRNLAPREAL